MKFQLISTLKTRLKTTYRTIYRTQMDHSQDWPWLMMEINPTSSHLQAFKQIHGRKDLKQYYNQILLWWWEHWLEVRRKWYHYKILLWWCLNWRHLLEVRWHARTWRWGNILCSSLWITTFWLDGLVTEGSFHKTKVHTGTSGKVSMLTMTLRTKFPDMWPVSAPPNLQLWRSLDVQCSGATRT